MVKKNKKKRRRLPKIDSIRERKKLIELYMLAYQGVKKTLENINKQLDKGTGLSDEFVRFLKNSNDIISALETKIKGLEEGEKEEESTVDWSKGLREFQERFFVQKRIFKEIYEREFTMADKDKVYLQFDYYRCKCCGELHPIDVLCPWLQLAKECGLEVNEDLTVILNEEEEEKD